MFEGSGLEDGKGHIVQKHAVARRQLGQSCVRLTDRPAQFPLQAMEGLYTPAKPLLTLD